LLFHSIFDKKEYEKEIKVVKEEVMKRSDDYYNVIYNESETMLYQGTPFQHPIDTVAYHTKENLYKYKDVVAMYDLYYRPCNVVVSVVSNLSYEEILSMIKKTHFYKKKKVVCPSWEKKNQLVFPPTMASGIQYNFIKKPEAHVDYLLVSFRTCSQFSPDIHSLSILEKILGGYLSSRLFMLLREKNGLTYSSGVSTQHFECGGDFTIYALTDPSKLIKHGTKKGVLPLVFGLLRDLLKTGVTQEEVQLAKDNYKGTMIRYMESMENQVLYNGTEVLLFDRKEIVPYEDYYKTFIEPVTKQDLDRVIQMYFKESNMVVSLLGPQLPEGKVKSFRLV
jgi:predicted Zn-dependent peptidase